MSSYKILIVLALVLLVTIPSGLALADHEVSGEGTAVIVDGLAPSNTVIFSLTGVDIPDEGEVYEGWLVSDDGSTKLSTGILSVSADGSVSHTFTSPSDENFIANYDKAVVTVEPVNDSDPGPSDHVAFVHQIAPAAMAHIRHLLTEWPAGDDMGILGNLKGQLEAAVAHAALAANASDIDGVRTHLHHVINILEGEDGANFDGSFGNPGDGIGAITHAQDRKHAGFAAGAAPDDDVIAEHAALVEEHGANAEDWATQASEDAVDALDVDSFVGAQILAGALGSLLQDALDGTDDGSSFGAEMAYIEAQLMATYTLPSPAAPAPPPIVELPVVGDGTVPLLAQIGLALGVLLLSAGGFVLLRGRRSRIMA